MVSVPFRHIEDVDGRPRVGRREETTLRERRRQRLILRCVVGPSPIVRHVC